MTFYEHLALTKSERLAERIFDQFDTNRKTEVRWFTELKDNM